MRFTIVNHSGSSQPPQLSHDFSPPGGTIGRSTENNWYLPDDGQAIARLQAIVSISADGECRINNQGAASEVLLNMIPLAPNRQVEIRDGDMLNIGNYQIQVIDINKNPSQQATPHGINTGYSLTASETKMPSEIWDDLEHILTASTPPSSSDSPQAKPEINDNNPLVTNQYDKERNPIDPLAEIEPTTDFDALQLRATDPIAMFKADTTFQQEDILDDHTPTTLLPHDENDQDDDKQEVDPLSLFSDKHIKAAQSTKNDELLNQILDKAIPLNAVDDATISTSQLFSQPSPPSSELFEEKILKEPANLEETDQDAQPHQDNSVKLEGKLLAALLDGMGLKEIDSLQFDEQKMYQLGLLVSQLTQGIVTLNTLRTQLKHETNAATPQPQSNANNPFKLLPSSQSILVLMLCHHVPGFMPLELATRDILIELQAHQLGMIAGIRAVTTNILHVFHPATLERKAREDNEFPRFSLSLANNKASMWEYLIKHYQETEKEFKQDSFLFGEKFLQAYEAEVNRYKNSQYNGE
ncbi:type VI secretion system-associated FHA domain protein TagH [Xenorhabdus sp. BG5]|uniref:type VI secretion system-associated FHA domain protein TagH n=1 Tax=Xenorhabdus sp. BG5 TaxID=2782014 RepID=UPI00187FD82B|nr:type VI secretion system-associated FHA domain protein TagH [Xenorhabdus sp. BG5]MBE8595148.1 type VI secretion system-associated FHA domain protein TagH [Xenorhabdus sp. BG5]